MFDNSSTFVLIKIGQINYFYSFCMIFFTLLFSDIDIPDLV